MHVMTIDDLKKCTSPPTFSQTVLRVDNSGDMITITKVSPVCVVGSWDGFSKPVASETGEAGGY